MILDSSYFKYSCIILYYYLDNNFQEMNEGLLDKILRHQENSDTGVQEYKNMYEVYNPINLKSLGHTNVHSNNTFINIQFNLVVTIVIFSSIIIVFLVGIVLSICLPKNFIPKKCRKLRRDNTIYDFNPYIVHQINQQTCPSPPSAPLTITNTNSHPQTHQQHNDLRHQQVIQAQNHQDHYSIITIDPSVILMSDK